MPTRLADSPLKCVAEGAGRSVLDLLGFLLLLIFILVSSIILLTRENTVANTAVPIK
jgi:hypothetical protein